MANSGIFFFNVDFTVDGITNELNDENLGNNASTMHHHKASGVGPAMLASLLYAVSIRKVHLAEGVGVGKRSALSTFNPHFHHFHTD